MSSNELKQDSILIFCYQIIVNAINITNRKCVVNNEQALLKIINLERKENAFCKMGEGCFCLLLWIRTRDMHESSKVQ